MKKTVAFELRTDTGNSVRDLENMEATAATIKHRMDEIEDATRNISKATRDSDATTNLEKLNRVVDENVLGWQEMGQAVDSYRNIARAAGTESPIGQEALQNAAALEMEMENLQTEIASLSTRGRELQSALQLGTGIVAGYSAFQGVTAMLGTENEELLETITKLQAAQSTLMGVEQLRQVLERDSLLMVQARIVATRARTVATNLLSRATTGATAATKALNVAMSVGVIGAITAAVALLVANWDKLVEVLGVATTEEQKLSDAYLNNSEERIGQIQKEVAERQKEIDMIIRKRQLEGASAAELAALRGERSEAAKEMYQTELDGIDAAIAKQEKFQKFQEDNADAVARREEKIQELLRSRTIIEDELNQIELERIDNINKAQSEVVAMLEEREQKEKELAEQAAELRAKGLEEEAAAVEARIALEAEEQARLEELRLQNADDEIGLLKLKHEREREEIRQKYGEETELLKELKIQQDEEVRTLEEELRLAEQERETERREEEYERQRELFELEMEQRAIDNEARREQELEFLNTMYEQGLLSAEGYNEGLEQLNKDRLANERDTDLQVADAKKMLAQESMNLFATLGGLMEEGSAAATAFAGIQIAADTAKALVAAIAGAAAAASAGGPAAPFLLAAYIASGIGAVLGAVASAKQLLSKAGGSTPSVSAPTIQQPSTPNMSGGSQGQGGNRVVAGQNTTGANIPPTQVVVLASDVQDTNNENNNIDVVSTWG